MSLPPRSFYSLTEVAVRWSVMPFDVIGWSTDGLLALSIALPPVKTEPAETLSGLADVEAPHLLPLFRRDGTPSPTVVVRRVKAGERGLCWIVEPMDGVGITAADVLVRRAEVERFERQYGFSMDCTCRRLAAKRQGAGGPVPACRRGTIGMRSTARSRVAFMTMACPRPRQS